MQDFGSTSWIALVGQRAAEFFATIATILAALPGAPAAFGGALQTVAAQPGGWMHGALLAVAAAVLVFCPAQWPILRPGSRLAARFGWRDLWGALVDDAATAAAVIVLAGLWVALLAPGRDAAGQFAAAVLWGAARWRISMLAVDMIVRPGRPHLRIVPLPEASVQAARRRAGACLALGLAFVSIVPVLLDHGLPLLQARAVALAAGTVDALLAAAALDAVVRGLPSHRNAAAAGGIALVAATWWIWIRSVALLDFTLYDAFTATVVVGWIVATIAGIGRLAVGAPDGPVPDAAHDGRALAVAALRRSLLVAAVTLGSAWVLRDWLVEVLEVVAPDAWPGVSRALSLGAGVALAGYLVHEALRTWSALRFGAPRPPSMPGGEDDDQFAGSRMATALPIVARSLLAISIGVGALLGLANLGINVGPLLAGAGIFGLAISFGSQALVRDIVSGFFFIADDAFRVGEYIDAGRHKGSVERISLRSLRLRHQNGQVHTIPYGQIAAVTNFSRDWATMKFNLRLAPETDLELVRKTAKRVGLALLDDPEWQAEFLVPLKLQGIADIVETAVVLRFKFTARPLKVASLQREVVRRLFDALLAAGVRFATNALVVRSDDTGEDVMPHTAPVRERAPVWARFGLMPRRPSDRIRTRRPPALNVRTP